MEANSISRKSSLDDNALKLQPASSSMVGPCVRPIAARHLSEWVSDGPIRDAMVFQYALVKRFDLVAEDHKVLCV